MPTLTDCLESDHRRLDAILAECRSLAAAGSFPVASERFATFGRGLCRHIDAEEDILFPALEERAPHAAGPMRVMRAEHAELLEIIAAVAAALVGSDPAWRSRLQQLEDVLVAHNAKEERVLYPMANEVSRDDPELEGLAASLAGSLG